MTNRFTVNTAFVTNCIFYWHINITSKLVVKALLLLLWRKGNASILGWMEYVSINKTVHDPLAEASTTWVQLNFFCELLTSSYITEKYVYEL